MTDSTDHTGRRGAGRAVQNVSDLLKPDTQAGHHRQTRRARESAIAEDYVEMIADLIDTQGEARAADIARRLGVTQASVAKMTARLQQAGLVTSQPYRAIFLTEEGRRIAEISRQRHLIVVDFLCALGISDEAAHADAEGMEHHCSAETLAAFQRFIDEKG
jgi:DtxR family manganese transport transcriptional regulator